MKFTTLACLFATSSAFVQQPPAFLSASKVAIAPQHQTFLNLFGGNKKGDISEEEVRSLFGLWNDALSTGDSRLVATRYASDAVLLPTVSDTPRTNFDLIKDYFDSFLLKKPQGVITEGYITIGDDWCQDVGIYEFTMGTTGDKVKARYTFVYVLEDGKWKIGHHHSSIMPESIDIATPITEEEVKSLFYLWNNALATLDSDKVAARYAKDPVLLPTVSDTPRNDYDTIKDYFDAFLLKKPQGKILESNVIVGTNWAQDAGIYEFTMGSTGDVVKARYSFIYVYEDGEWKISHHHSSMMPEETIPQNISKDDVRGFFNLWNDALATLDSDTVAKRYASKTLLLPTVSDSPRKDYDSIKDYFDAFLQKEPQGVILTSDVIVGHNWAQDAGIYEFTMGTTGDKVKARYSFIYVFEGGEWKIAHHHSSMMPEPMLASAPADTSAKPAVAGDVNMGEEISVPQVQALFSLWNDALATGDSRLVTARYAKDAVLLPTVSDLPRTDPDLIKDYFDNFLTKKPQGVILESNVMIGNNWAQDAGIYEFTMGATGDKVKARYTFVYVFEDGQWKIAHHHSSMMPEGVITATPISESEVRKLFNLWNDALATGNSKTVADRYATSSTLLPTVSDVPRNDYNSIVDYFDAFLQKKPQGVILEGKIVTGPNWAQDAGIYEFTMGATGDVVKARYSFIYVYEEGEWKISHHHSSVMPESVLPTPITKDEVRGLFNLWNDALATGKPDVVASRYAKDPVLLPTVSDTPRTNEALIKDYFVSFLKKEPQGEILSGEITIGNDWCQDAGIYEFTMGSDGSKVKARYSFIYVMEDGEWKISHHHSSVMPEAFLAAATAK